MKKLIAISLLVSIFSLSFAVSRGVGFLRALAVPGWSQIASGHSYGYAMVASELGIIGSLMYFGNESDVLKQDSYEYAVKFAHLNPGYYDSKFYNNLSRYESSGFDANGYNAMVRQSAMTMFPYDAAAQQSYIDENGYFENKYWSWDSPSDRSQYNKLRNKSQDYEDYASVTAGVLILNHLISGVDYLLFSERDKEKANVYMSVKDNEPILCFKYRW